MKLSDFASEFEQFQLPIDLGDPKGAVDLTSQISAKGTQFRVDESLMNLIGNAVYGFYFAKSACPALDALAAAQGGGRQGAAVRHVRDSLLKSAIIGIATTIDQVGRTRSLVHALNALELDLKNRQTQRPDDETGAALELLAHLRTHVNPDTVVSLAYVRHLRNKWASHSSLDIAVDGWADADKHVDLRIVEDALARMVNAFQDLSVLVPMSKDLHDIEVQDGTAQVGPDGTTRYEMTVAWSGANALAQVMRTEAQQAADALLGVFRAGTANLSD